MLYSCYITGDSRNSIHSSIEETKVTLVFFLGGCTYAEISALRFLSKRDDCELSVYTGLFVGLNN